MPKAKSAAPKTAPDFAALDAACLVAPGTPAALHTRPTKLDHVWASKEEGQKQAQADSAAIDALQDALYAERTRALLVVLQGIDTSGKDGTVRAVFNACGPLGVRVTPFGRPSELELAHDYLWRVHQAVPSKGMIGIFNRSHYEDVLVAKVRALAPPDAIEARYAQINSFEKHLTETGTMILKFMLHISKDEQRQRLQDRLDDPTKHWKFNPGDLEDRARWDAYQEAYEIACTRCSTDHAPWRIIPADSKTQRNALIARVVRRTLEAMAPAYPPAAFDAKAMVVE